jgi:hypothetical protein
MYISGCMSCNTRISSGRLGWRNRQWYLKA